jgi:hypothetical protein
MVLPSAPGYIPVSRRSLASALYALGGGSLPAF